MADLLIGFGLIAILSLSLWTIRRGKKKGKSCCSDCNSSGGCPMCH
ncbi:MAG: FeoB-associated Cys-rich membrane protein [Succinivibrionaceae bacterium]|nr:FeoB-associated Cys-rich membrane protein [Succinivibrionaceae bacterium]